MSLRDGSHFDVTVPPAGTFADVLAVINTASAGKATASVTADGKGLKLVDNSTTGAAAFSVGGLNGSTAALDLGLSVTPVGSTLTGTQIFSPSSATGGGIGYLIDRSMTRLVDPVDGVLPRGTKVLDDKAQQFQDRMDALDVLIAAKRARLEEQFANMESVLAGLQSQQAALGSLAGAASVASSAASSSSASKSSSSSG